MQLQFLVFSCSVLVFFLTVMVLRYLKREELIVRARMKTLFGADEFEEKRQKQQKESRKGGKVRIPVTKTAFRTLATELSLSGIRLRAEEFLGIWGGLAFVPACISLLFGADWLIAFALLILGTVLPFWYVKRSKAKRLAQFEQQLGDALMIIGNCLRTGLSFQQALNSIATDMPEPISKEFGRVNREVQLGVSLETALENMVVRLNSQDFMLIVSAVLIQRQVGGNLTEILDSISGTIRERLKIKANIKVLTATGRMSGIVIGLLPVIMLLLLMLINPSYIRSFFETTVGTLMLCVGGVMEIIGFMAVKKVVTIKY